MRGAVEASRRAGGSKQKRGQVLRLRTTFAGHPSSSLGIADAGRKVESLGPAKLAKVRKTEHCRQRAWEFDTLYCPGSLLRPSVFPARCQCWFPDSPLTPDCGSVMIILLLLGQQPQRNIEMGCSAQVGMEKRANRRSEHAAFPPSRVQVIWERSTGLHQGGARDQTHTQGSQSRPYFSVFCATVIQKDLLDGNTFAISVTGSVHRAAEHYES